MVSESLAKKEKAEIKAKGEWIECLDLMEMSEERKHWNYKKKRIEDPIIIAQFSTRCGDSIYDCDCDIYAYKDSFSIRKRGMNVVGQSNDRVLYDEVKMLWMALSTLAIFQFQLIVR